MSPKLGPRLLRGAVIAVLTPMAAGTFALGLSARALAQSASGPDLTVRVAVTPEITRMPGWAAGFRCALSRASRILEPGLGRKLAAADRVTWSGAGGRDDLYELRAHMVDSVEAGGASLVVGLVAAQGANAPAGAPIVEDGLASYSHGYVVLRVGTDLCAAGRLLAHEIAHVFGGIHRSGAHNLMDHGAAGEEFDELNAALLSLHADRMVRGEPPPLRGESLRMMWRLTRADIESAGTWTRVGVLAARMGKHGAACQHYERALSLSPTLREAWVNLGHARLQLGQFESAEESYLQALAIDADDGLLHNNLAVIYLSTGRTERAAAALERALDLGYDVPEQLRRAIADVRG